MSNKSQSYPGVLIIFIVLLFSCKTQENVASDNDGPIPEIVEPKESVDHEKEEKSIDSTTTEEEYSYDDVSAADGHERYSKAALKGAPAEVAGDVMARPVRTDKSAVTKGEPVKIDPETLIVPRAGLLTAAEWNDLSNWDDWKELMNNQDFNEMQSYWNLYPRSRYSIFVKNQYELPLQDIPVYLQDQSGRVIWSARTDNSGRAELWADMTESERSFEKPDVKAVVDGKPHLLSDVQSIDKGVNLLSIDSECVTSPSVDILFAVDATGSMGDEIQFLQKELSDVIMRSQASNTKLSLRMGAVFYRDSSDSYLTRVSPLSDDLDMTLGFIGEQTAEGGGDYPEAVDAALDEVLAQDWSEHAIARIVFLLLDAPPHKKSSVLSKVQQQVIDAAREGIKIIPITASGINRQTEFLMKFMAIATNGTYVFITDHSGIGNPHLDPVVKDYEVEKLNDLLVRLIYNYTKSNGCNANNSNASGIRFFPNPARQYVNVNTDQPIRVLKVLSNSGKVMHKRSNLDRGETKIEIAGLVDGIYTIHCQGDNLDVSQPLVVINR